jgi:UDP-3-O-acyl N-acetylglucosamine deacetylase
VRNQKTLRSPATFRGAGLHSGRDVTTIVKPADADTGVVFVRTDVPGQPRIPMRGEAALKRDRRTVISNGDCEVETVEHLAAGLWVLGIDNAVVEIDGPEVPALDGSALPFAEGLRDAGRVEQKAPRKVFALDQPVAVADGDGSLTAFPNESGLRISYTLDYGDTPALRPQFVSVDVTEEKFFSQIAPARTFCLETEAKLLQDAGFGRGASTKNTLVIGDGGVIDNSYRLEDEPARHKVLDLIGDLALLGADLCGHVVAYRSGHPLNVELTRALYRRLAVPVNHHARAA